jgi:hypothetical protein
MTVVLTKLLVLSQYILFISYLETLSHPKIEHGVTGWTTFGKDIETNSRGPRQDTVAVPS